MEATLQGIFRAGYGSYKKRHGVSMDQHQAAQAIMACQGEALGYESWACLNGDHEEKQYHSCRHRSCPRCHSAERHDWLEKSNARLLPCEHYHVVFTLPHELNPVWHFNRHWCSDKLFKAASETLRELLQDERYLGAEVGMLASLHSWGRTLSFHPHVHVLVSGGGLNKRGEWRPVRNGFLLPVGVLKAKFRGKWLSWLNEAYAKGELRLPSDWLDRDWRKALSQAAGKNWNIRIQGSYSHGSGVTNYLSRYVRGGPISDKRLVEVSGKKVSFRYRDHRDSKTKTLSLGTEHFMSRILWHVPVKGQHNVRYYGLYLPGKVEKRDSVREILGSLPGEKARENAKLERRCPECNALLYHRYSRRSEISYIRYEHVQQEDQADLGKLWSSPSKSPQRIFWPELRQLI